jgi:cellulose synthase/poly-beta-1,6-N-acetylglucosamine synthase-like glycosyltransferase
MAKPYFCRLAKNPSCRKAFKHMDWQNLILTHGPLWAFFILVGVGVIQLFYYLFFFTRVAGYKSKDKFQSQTHPVSVVICTRDEAQNLELNAPVVLTQNYGTTHEVVIVNDNSFDDTKYFLEELQKVFKHLNPITLTQEAKHIPGKKWPLSVGIKSSKYEVMLLTDADCRPASEWWIQKMQDAYHDGKELVLGYGAYDKKPGLLNKLVRWETYLTALQYMSYALAGIPYMGVGRNLSYRKDLFFRMKGFSSLNHIPGGDDDLFINKVATKENTAIVLDPDAFTISVPPASFSAWWRQKARHYSTAKYYRPLHKFLLAMFSMSHVLFYPALVVTAVFYNWQLALMVYGVRFIAQGIVLYLTLKRFNEKDLAPFFWLLDIWQWFYYIIFSLALAKKPSTTWK